MPFNLLRGGLLQASRSTLYLDSEGLLCYFEDVISTLMVRVLKG